MNANEKKTLYLCGLFQNIPPEEVETLLTCLGAEEARYDKNQVIWHAGDPIHSCALILSGAVRAESISSTGENVLIAYHTPGALVGDVLMATPGGCSPVYVTAAEPTTLIYLPFHSIMSGCGKSCPRHTLLRENLISEIAQKYWALRRRMGYLSVKGMRQRIAMYLADQSAKAGSTTFRLDGTREDLADLLGVNRSALSRELSRMKAEGILDYYRGTFRILEPDRLAFWESWTDS